MPQSTGTQVIPTQTAIAFGEMRVATRRLEKHYVLVPLVVDPERHVEVWPDEQLPHNWDRFPHVGATREIGTTWVKESGR